MEAALDKLPHEVLYLIFLNIPPSSVPTLQQVCRSFNGVSQPLLWRHHCRTLFKYWAPEHGIQAKLAGDVNKVDWKRIFSDRHRFDHSISHEIGSILSSQDGRIEKAEKIIRYGYDAKDTLLQNLKVGNSAEDELARRYYSDAVLSCLHRTMAIGEWAKLMKGEVVPLERALASFDMFVLHDRDGDFDDISNLLDRIVEKFRIETPNFTEKSPRRQAVAVAEFLRQHGLIGIKGNVNAHYHDLQNNFLGIALQDENHPSLPLISVAIYCCVAQRLGIDARPCGFPFHVLSIVKPPQGMTLNGRIGQADEVAQSMYMDPFRSSTEVPLQDLTAQLANLGIPVQNHAGYLDVASTSEIVRRSATNIITSVQTLPRNNGVAPLSTIDSFPEMDGAFYAALWALILLPDGSPLAASNRRAFLPYIVQHAERLFYMDLHLIEKYIFPLLMNIGELEELQETVRVMRARDAKPKQTKRRSPEISNTVHFKVGQVFRHKRYHYHAVITGWDVECLAGDAWMSQMRIHELSMGKHQSFYHVLVEDKSVRYVAEENIIVLQSEPSQGLMAIAGQHFKRWDDRTKSFVSNINDEYPDD